MAAVLVLGASGYIGQQLVPELIKGGHDVRCLVRERSRAPESITRNTELYVGDVLSPDTLEAPCRNVDAIYYLIHSMGSGQGDFEDLDRQAAKNVARIAQQSGVQRIIYLGGLGKKSDDQSPHLRSRHEVAELLGSTGIPVTELRAAIVVGAGGSSFEIIHHLVNRLPLMVCPRWVNTKTQPIAIGDVLGYLRKSLELPETTGCTYDIGGPDIMTFREMMLAVAKVLRLRRLLLQVPVLTPKLSSYWVNFVTPMNTALARTLVESLRHETVCEDDSAPSVFSIAPTPMSTAIADALRGVAPGDSPLKSNSGFVNRMTVVEPSHLFQDRRVLPAQTTPDHLFTTLCSLGGDNGWFYADRLWRLRGWMDRVFGGVGMRRTPRPPGIPVVGDTIDFWRVEACEPDKRLLLHAEMNVWGHAWLEFLCDPAAAGEAQLTQTAWYYPRGLWGFVYWHLVLPLHSLVFPGLAREIVRRAEKSFRK